MKASCEFVCFNQQNQSVVTIFVNCPPLIQQWYTPVTMPKYSPYELNPMESQSSEWPILKLPAPGGAGLATLFLRAEFKLGPVEQYNEL